MNLSLPSSFSCYFHIWSYWTCATPSQSGKLCSPENLPSRDASALNITSSSSSNGSLPLYMQPPLPPIRRAQATCAFSRACSTLWHRSGADGSKRVYLEATEIGGRWGMVLYKAWWGERSQCIMYERQYRAVLKMGPQICCLMETGSVGFENDTFGSKWQV